MLVLNEVNGPSILLVQIFTRCEGGILSLVYVLSYPVIVIYLLNLFKKAEQELLHQEVPHEPQALLGVYEPHVKG